MNVAGILGDGRKDPGPERSIGRINRDWLHKSLNVNTVGHVMVTQSLLRLMTSRTSGDVAKVVNISARVGSLSDNMYDGSDYLLSTLLRS